jgi:hypothetical protein
MHELLLDLYRLTWWPPLIVVCDKEPVLLSDSLSCKNAMTIPDVVLLSTVYGLH